MSFTRSQKRLPLLAIVALALVLAVSCGKKAQQTGGHTLVLKDGTILKGELVSRTDAGVKFETGGEVREIAMDQVYSLTLKEGEKPVYLASAECATETEKPAPTTQAAPEKSKPASTPAAATSAQKESAPAAAKPAPPPEPKPVTVAAGSRLMLKLKDNLGTATHQTGAKFTAVLEADLVASGVVVAPKGTTVYGKVLESSGGKRVGKQRLLATFTEISINNQAVAIVTDEVGAEGAPGGAAKKVGAGALIGAAAGDAAAGAAVGGALALLGPGGQINIPAGTLVEVSLKQPFTVMK